MNLTSPQINAEDCKDHEEKDGEGEDAAELSHRLQERSDESPHGGHGGEVAQRPEEAEGSQSRDVVQLRQ